jgi:subtilisin-like proprotein convertase family protein
VAIPDNDQAGVSNTITVPDSLPIAELSVEVEIAHSWRGDLVVELVRGETVVTLASREGGSADDMVASFDVPAFAGQNAQGAWTLRVKDLAAADTGTLTGWSLVVVSR